jgi:cytochrome c2/transcriptional regulator with XRE-family HTH domain
MADRGDTHYRVASLNLWFAVSSLLLLVATVWMMLNDWNRPWKQYQREFRRIEIAQVQGQEKELEQKGGLATEAELQRAVEQAQAESAQKQSELDAALERQRLAKGELWRITEEAKKRKAEFNWERFLAEEERLHTGDPNYGAEQIEAGEKKMNAAIGEQQEAEQGFAKAQQEVASLTGKSDKARAALVAGTRDLDRLRKKLEQMQPSDGAAKVVSVIRDAPGIDFIGPTLKVNKVVLDNLTFELNFTKSKRIDMCHTCHLGIDRAGFEAEKNPFKTHPRLDLYLTAKSPHPLKTVGCSICHRGGGEALDFVRADHRPANEEQEREWEQKLGWHKQHHWDYPMLARDFTEASCVQCHKTTMELIAADAPVLSEGYRTFERYGCYACHKVDWFPTKRRPGPQLKNLQAKLTPEFLTAWIANPKSFRPTTWMPQFFHLENYASQEGIVESKYGAGRKILGGEWSDATIAAISAFLLERAPRQEFPPVPVPGNAVRGREVMRVSGCLACHNMAPYGSQEAKTHDLALERRGSNEHGPNLRGVASKVNEAWLYAWIKDPKAYWPDTRMPNLRLSDQDAADITAYMMEDPDGIFRQVPEGWKPGLIAMPEDQLREVLAEQARWTYARDGRAVIEARLEGKDPKAPWNDLHALEVAVGEKLVGQYGCFSCHEISGMEDMMPIGTELSNWGSKTVDKLDFGFAYQKELGSRPMLSHEYREGWLMRKLHAPRSFDLEKVKNPTEKLRMPYFGFTDEQVQTLSTFVVGLVDDEVQRAKMVPRPEQLAMDAGMRAARQKNCIACHVIDPGTATFEDEHGALRTITAELLPFEDKTQPPPHDLKAVLAQAEETSADEVGFRLLRSEPDVPGKVGEKFFIAKDKLKALHPANGGEFVRVITDYYFNGIELFDAQAANPDEAFSYVTADPEGTAAVEDVDGKFRDHSSEPYDKIRWTFAPPVLWNEGAKVQRPWFFSFLNDVVPLRQQLRVRMPSFHFYDGESEAIADYFAHKSAAEWPARFARSLRLYLGVPREDLAKQAGLDVVVLEGIENGSKPDTLAGLAKLQAFATAKGFQFPPAVRPAYEPVRVRASGYLSQREAEQPGHLQLGEQLVSSAVNCYQCHFRMGKPPPADPIAWGPDLMRAYERLREDWTLEWLRNPQGTYPGTSMPANFAGDPPQYQDVYPNSTNEQQLRVVLEWLFNFDRVSMGGDGVRSAMTTPNPSKQ